MCARFSASSFSLVSPWDLASLSSSDLSCSMEFRRASSCVRRSCRLRLNCDCSAVLLSPHVLDLPHHGPALLLRREQLLLMLRTARLALLQQRLQQSMSDLLRLNWCCSASRFCPSPSS